MSLVFYYLFDAYARGWLEYVNASEGVGGFSTYNAQKQVKQNSRASKPIQTLEFTEEFIDRNL